MKASERIMRHWIMPASPDSELCARIRVSSIVRGTRAYWLPRALLILKRQANLVRSANRCLSCQRDASLESNSPRVSNSKKMADKDIAHTILPNEEQVLNVSDPKKSLPSTPNPVSFDFYLTNYKVSKIIAGGCS